MAGTLFVGEGSSGLKGCCQYLCPGPGITSRTSAQQMSALPKTDLYNECLGKAFQIPQSSFLSFLPHCWSHLSSGGRCVVPPFTLTPWQILPPCWSATLERARRQQPEPPAEVPEPVLETGTSGGWYSGSTGGGGSGLAGEALLCLGCLEWGACCADL